MKSHDKTHAYPGGYEPIAGEENVHGKPGMKQGTTKAVKTNKAAEKKAAAKTPKRSRGR